MAGVIYQGFTGIKLRRPIFRRITIFFPDLKDWHIVKKYFAYMLKLRCGFLTHMVICET